MLPSSEQILAFADAINELRADYGLPPVEVWDVSGCEPDSTCSCLSARHFVGPAEFGSPKARDADWWLVGAVTFMLRGGDMPIPEPVLAVTDRFDSGPLDEGEMHAWVQAFRDAGLKAE